MTRARIAPGELPARLDCIVEVIRAYAAEYQRPPTLREIAERAGLAGPGLARHYVIKLEQAGRVKREPGSFRTIVVVEQEWEQ